jgi:hypothetical protein
MTTLPEQYAYTRDTGERVEPGALLESRGETWTFESVSRQAYGNSTGRVLVSAACGDGLTPCAHAWHIDGIERREFFPHVFNLYLGLENGEEA